LTSKRIIKFTVIAGISLLLLSCGADENRPQGKTASAAIPVEGLIIRPGELSSTVMASGTVLSMDETIIYPEVNGRIISLNIPEGQTVAKGDLLVKLYDADLQAQLKSTEAQLKLAKETEKRLSELLGVNGIARQEYDQAVLQVQVLEAQSDVIRASISKTEIRAPYNGIVGLRQVSMGAMVNQQVSICTIRSKNDLKIDFSVPEKYSSFIKKDLKVQFTMGADTTVHIARVIASEESVDMDTRNLNVRALIEGNPILVPGSFANVKLPLDVSSASIMVPSQCIIPQGRKKVVIVNRGGKASFTPVETGVRQNELVEITQGLQSGDTIAVTGVLFLRPNAPMVFSNVTEQN
jgi:membrane fusion protein (multidrug efflux system)